MELEEQSVMTAGTYWMLTSFVVSLDSNELKELPIGQLMGREKAEYGLLSYGVQGMKVH